MRRVVERDAGAPGPYENNGPDDSGPRAPSAPSAPPAPRRAAPELEEPAWLRSDPAPESPPATPSAAEQGGPFALFDESEWKAAMPRTPTRAMDPSRPEPTSQAEVPWLAGYEPDAVRSSRPAEPTRPAPSGDMIAIPPSELFPTRSIPTEDENAAATLASVFEPEFAARLTPVRPMPTQPRSQEQRPPTPATRKAEEELSLDQVFGRKPASGTPQARSGFTFDQFFDEKKDANREGAQDPSSEIELFNTWLDQLKK
jgi:hypothetical protein